MRGVATVLLGLQLTVAGGFLHVGDDPNTTTDNIGGLLMVVGFLVAALGVALTRD